MNKVTRKTLLRLLVVTAFLAAYPVAILVLRAVTPLSIGEDLTGFEARLEVVEDQPPCVLRLMLRLEHPREATFEVASVGISVFEDDVEQLTRLETGAPLAARTKIGSDGQTAIGPFCLDLADRSGDQTLVVTTRVVHPDSGGTRSLMREARLVEGRVELIEPETVSPPDFLVRPRGEAAIAPGAEPAAR